MPAAEIPITFIVDLSAEHPWFSYAPEYNPLAVFVLYDGTVNTLPISCVGPQNVTSKIADAVTKYMRCAVLITPENHQVRTT